MGRFDGILICTDLDGTLLRRGDIISEENTEAIEYFKREGGYFTFITGRMPFFSAHFCDAIRPNAPFGCVNGCGLYDSGRGEYIWTAKMGEGVEELIRAVDECFPSVGIQVNTFYHTYFCKENVTMQSFRRATGLENLTCDYNAVTEPIGKILFGGPDPEEMIAVEAMLRAHPLADRFDFVRSEPTLCEILPKGIGKGTAITRLCEHLGLDIRRSIAIGDYNNDISMFRAAGVGIAVANACAEAKAAADRITVSNEEHAIARVICDLRDGVFSL